MRLTEDQQRAVEARGSVAVTAGAGTGKTELLSRRYCQHLAQDPERISPLEIVVLTFTEKAATELRTRIRKAVSQEWPQRRDWLAEVEAAQISTFHSLCARICREHPEAAGVDPDFAILDDLDGALWRLEALPSAMLALPDTCYELLGYDEWRSLLEALLADPERSLELLERDGEDWRQALVLAQQQQLGQLCASEVWRDGLDLLAGASWRDPDNLSAQITDILTWARALEQPGQHDWRAALRQLRDLTLTRAGKAANWGGAEPVKRLKATCKSLRDLVKEDRLLTLESNTADDWNAAQRPRIREAFGLVLDALDARKREDRLLDFSDLERAARRALDQPTVRDHYRQRWRYCFVDEFQDTSPIQGEILRQLWQPDTMTLTLVGDEKQSIYGFRGADTAVFREWRQLLTQEEGEVVTLRRSFRTHAVLLEAVNRVFDVVLGDQHQPLENDRPAPHDLPPIQRLLVAEDAATTVAEQRRREAEAIAERIAAWIAQPLWVWDKGTQQSRELRYGDIAILCRRRDPLESIYGEVLAARGLPVLVNGGGSLLETAISTDVLALLEFLADPGDDLALATLLRSPAFGLTDAQLYALAQGGRGWWKRRDAVTDPGTAQALATLQKLVPLRFIETPLRLVQLFDRATAYSAVLAGLSQPERRLADWRALLDLLRDSDSAHDLDLLLRRWRLWRQAGVELPRPVLEAGNAITLMTLHAAKGLEWPVVILADLATKPHVNTDPVLFDRELGVAIRQPYVEEKPAAYEFFRWRQQQADADETRRLLYVGLTRARDLLLLSSATKPASNSPLGLLSPGLEAVPLEVISEPATIPLTEATPAVAIAAAAISVTPITPEYPELAVTTFADYVRCPAQFHFRHTLGHPGVVEESPDQPLPPNRALNLGQLVHRALERDIRQPEVLLRWCEPGDHDLVPQALELAARFHTHEAYAFLRQDEVRREAGLSLTLESGLRLTGRADLVGPDWVVDFKTDRDPQPNHHRLQLWAYARALQVERGAIAWLRHDRLDWLELDNLHEQAEVAADQLLRGEFTPQPGPVCDRCPYRTICEAAVLTGSEASRES